MNQKLIIFIALSINSTSAISKQWGFEIKLSSYSNSESLPIKSLVDNSWLGEYKKATSLFTTNRFEIALSRQHWHVGLAKRFDYFARYSEPTMRLFHQENNKLAPELNQHYPISLIVDESLASGAFIRYQDNFQQLKYQLTVNYWQSESMMSGQVTGAVDSNSAGQYSGLINFDYSYDKDTLFKRPEEPVSATGYSVDIDLAWQITEQMNMRLAVIDLIHRLDWDKVTHTSAIFDRTPDKASSTASISGREDYIDLTQRFDPQTYLNFSYGTNWARWQVGLDYINQQAYPYLGLSKKFDLINADIELAYYPDTQAIKLGLEHANWGVELWLNTTDLDNANTIGLVTYLKY